MVGETTVTTQGTMDFQPAMNLSIMVLNHPNMMEENGARQIEAISSGDSNDQVPTELNGGSAADRRSPGRCPFRT